MILRATCRPRDDYDAPVRVFDIERPDYDGAWAVVRTQVDRSERLLHVRTIDDPAVD